MKRTKNILLGILLVVLVGGLTWYFSIKFIFKQFSKLRPDGNAVSVSEVVDTSVSEDDGHIDIAGQGSEVHPYENQDEEYPLPELNPQGTEAGSDSTVDGNSSDGNAEPGDGDSNTPQVVTPSLPEVDTDEYKVFQNYDFVFIGDSIFAEKDGNYTIPEYVKAYTGAEVYNLSKGGMCGSHGTAGWMSMPEAVENFVCQRKAEQQDTELFDSEIQRYIDADHSNRGMFIILNCCINDYTMGSLTTGDFSDCYVESYKNCIERLKGEFPWARVMVMTPYYYKNFDCGYEVNGLGFNQYYYVHLLEEIAASYNMLCMDMYVLTDFNENNWDEYLKDGLHPTDAGENVIAKALSSSLYQHFGQ